MIGRLRGRILHKQAPQLVVDVNGVGYEVDAPMSTFCGLPDLGEEVVLHTCMVVREDAHTLYGFATTAERTFFRHLIRVNGVGARLALAILSGISAQDFASCVLNNDTDALTRLPGVGKKTAERLIIEMRHRLEEWHDFAVPAAVAGGEAAVAAPADPVTDAVSALVALGYKPQEASRMVRGVDTANLASEDIIRLALQSVVK